MAHYSDLSFEVHERIEVERRVNFVRDLASIIQTPEYVFNQEINEIPATVLALIWTITSSSEIRDPILTQVDIDVINRIMPQVATECNIDGDINDFTQIVEIIGAYFVEVVLRKYFNPQEFIGQQYLSDVNLVVYDYLEGTQNFFPDKSLPVEFTNLLTDIFTPTGVLQNVQVQKFMTAVSTILNMIITKQSLIIINLQSLGDKMNDYLQQHLNTYYMNLFNHIFTKPLLEKILVCLVDVPEYQYTSDTDTDDIDTDATEYVTPAPIYVPFTTINLDCILE